MDLFHHVALAEQSTLLKTTTISDESVQFTAQQTVTTSGMVTLGRIFVPVHFSFSALHFIRNYQFYNKFGVDIAFHSEKQNN